jgi:hypothetical protein
VLTLHSTYRNTTIHVRLHNNVLLYDSGNRRLRGQAEAAIVIPSSTNKYLIPTILDHSAYEDSQFWQQKAQVDAAVADASFESLACTLAMFFVTNKDHNC